MVKFIVEGQDDTLFLRSYLKKLGYDYKKHSISKTNGKSTMLNYEKSEELYNNIEKEINKKSIKKIFFIFDADYEKDDKICGTLKKSKDCFEQLKEKLKWDAEIDYYIFENNLDSFLLSTLDKNECLKGFEKCMELNTLNPNRKIISIGNLY